MCFVNFVISKKNKLNVCLPLSRFEIGGLERVQLYLASGLAEHDMAVSLVTRKIEPKARALLKPETPLHVLTGNTYTFIGKLFFWLKKNNPEVIITSANDIGVLTLLLRRAFYRNSKIIWTQHLSISGPLHHAKGLQHIKLLLLLWLMRRLIKKSDAIIAVSHGVADDMKNLIHQDLPIEVIWNPVVDYDFEQKSNESIDWPWPDKNIPTVIFVGRLAEIKRLDLLLQAFHQCIQNSAARLLIVGDGSEKEMIHDFVKKLHLNDVCKLVGHQDNPLPWIQQSDLLVLCSDSEGFGLVLVEAMACGTQVLATDCPDGPAELLDQGRFGCLVPMNNAAALAAAMQNSLENPSVSKSELKARATEFSVEKAVVQYLKLINQVVEV